MATFKGTIHRKGKLRVSVPGVGIRIVEYRVTKSPAHVLGGLLYFRRPGEKWRFSANVRPSLNRAAIKGQAKAFLSGAV